MSTPPDRPARSSDVNGQSEGLVVRYRAPLIRYFKRRGMTATISEDLAHDTFLRLFALKGSSHVQNSEAYLFRIAGSVLNDYLRKSRVRWRHAAQVDDIFRPFSEAPSTERVLEGKEALARLETALAELKPRTREIFLLSRMEGLSYSQIAVRYGVTASAIEKHIAVALAHLVHRLRPAR